MDPIQQLQELLSKSCGLSIDLIINENRSHLFSILERKRSRARLSVHRMFLEAPEPVITALASYVKEFDRSALSIVSKFIDERVHAVEYRQKLNAEDLHTRGDYFDLRDILKRVKEHYFAGEGPSLITWFRQKKTRSRVIFGQYHPLMQLIKINKMLDDPSVPLYFIEYVVFHEMLHHIIPSVTGESGRRSIHSPAFRKREKDFLYFKQASEWQMKNRHLFFEGVF